jgi:selenocysteine lyase/cysteine desulfurase
MALRLEAGPIPAEHAIDLRRRRSRELGETIVDHARWSLPDDRAVLTAIYRDGLTAQEVATLRHEPPRRVRSRVRRLVARLLSDRFLFVLRRRDSWPTLRRRVASACVLQGLSMREAARRLRVSLHVVRTQMEVINALHREQN